MDDSFWFLAEDPTDARVDDVVQRAEHEPRQESMRGERRLTNAPSTDQKKIRRKIHRSGGYLDENDWDRNLSRIDAIHRGIGVHLPDDLHSYVHNESQPVEDRANALLSHVAGERGEHNTGGKDHREGLGPHWTSEKSVAEDFAEEDAQYRADQKHPHDDPEDYSWGRSKGDIHDDELHEHLIEDHGARPDLMENNRDLAPDNEWMLHAHEHVHKDASDEEHLRGYREPDVAHGKPATAVVIHGPSPMREDINDHNEGEGGMVYNWEDHGEKEINLHKGAEVPVTGISWAPIRSEDHPDKEWLPEYTHHTFNTPQGHYAFKTATVLNTQTERLNKGDQVRTPTGQTVTVKGKPRPHETDSTLMYLDTDMGTSTVKRGTDFQVIPYNAQQQELPDTGNPMNSGNTGQLPGSEHGPGGPGAGSGKRVAPDSPCPNCGNAGTLHLQGGMYICSVCGFTVAAGGAPGGLLFTDQPRGFAPGRRAPGEVPKAHVWASRYNTTEGSSQIARRARQVLGGDK